jgi:hypothetical protein
MALEGFDFDLRRGVIRDDSSVAAKIDMIFFAEVVFIEEVFADARNADKNSRANWSLSFLRCQWPRASIWFQLGNRPGTRRTIGSRAEVTGGEGEAGAFGGVFDFTELHGFATEAQRHRVLTTDKTG